MANKNQKRLRKIVSGQGQTLTFDVPRSDYDKGCAGGRAQPSSFVKREIAFGYQARHSKKPKVVWNAAGGKRSQD